LCGDLIDDVFTGDTRRAAGAAIFVAAGGVEESVGFLGGVSFVEEVVREGGVGGAEFGGESCCFGGLGAGCAVGMERVADDEDFDFVLADEASDGLEVGAWVGAVDGEERLRGVAERVSDGEANAAVADVESEDAGHIASVASFGGSG